MSVADFPAPYFLDTNIFVYSFDATETEKKDQARQLIRASLQSQQGVISTQVVQEFLNVAQRKFPTPLGPADARLYLSTVLMPLCQHFPSISFYDFALLLQAEVGFSLYDTLIVAAALEAGCKTLLTEDMQDGRIIRGMTIRNPFATASST